MNAPTDIVEIYDLLYHLGFSANSTAFFYLSYAVYLSVLNPQWLASPSRRLYPAVARHYRTDPTRIARDIEYLTYHFRRTNPDLPHILARRIIHTTLSPTQFLRILASHVREK